MQQDEVLTLDEVSDWLKVQPSTLYQWAYRRTGPRSFRAGKYRRYLRSDVQKWIDKQLVLDASGLDAGEQ